MGKPLICLTLTEKTLAEDLELVNKYRPFIDIVELRADFLTADERLVVKRFPKLAGIPCILTLRRRVDGGKFIEGEAGRTILFARALSFADSNPMNNFAYVDFEEDFHVPSLQDAALAFGTKIIRSVHDMENPIRNLPQRLESLRTTGYEIPKIAFMPHTLDDVTNMFKEASTLKDDNHILIAMGPMGLPSRILSAKLGNYLTFTSAIETKGNLPVLSLLDPITISSTYNFHNITKDTDVYGITGWPLTTSKSPSLFNADFKKKQMNAVYIPVASSKIQDSLSFADTVGMKGLSVTFPYKQKVLDYILETDAQVDQIGSSNTLVNRNGIWKAYNTDFLGFEKALLEFTDLKSLRFKRIAILGAGGAATAIAFSLHRLKAKVCVFNRTVSKAKALAQQFNFDYAPMNEESLSKLKHYSNIIIQATSLGTPDDTKESAENDPIPFYQFTGKECLYDITYSVEQTPLMERASLAGCKTCNGYTLMKYQADEQLKLYTGETE